MSKKTEKLTGKDILLWHGEDNGIEELADYLATILNGDFSIEKARKEIEEMMEE